ncbi:hypothetical protein [Streptomyces paromomycinus]|uniref:Uncharacterized protein n=1 Tax=Streptomyces paromomycinus TaxID=92743 RepID=A0A401WEQ5_STREY|nr:hypothetical protein [Streptomyces paromomycinus]GCD47826.1 hypothetical protein GKJPGBOP_07620 [Streptomyces paromomycinus]
MKPEISTITFFCVSPDAPDDGYFAPGEIRPLIDGRDVLDEVFDEGVTNLWESLEGDALAAGETAREVLLAGPECSTSCCGAVRVTIRREGPDVLWTDWENSSDGPGLPDFRFAAGQYDAEVARLARD